jgi:hypothetical protein
VKISVMIFLGAIGIMVQAKDGPDPLALTVNVYVREDFSDPNMRLPCAEKIASDVFEKIGVHIQWRMGQPKRSNAENSVS